MDILSSVIVLFVCHFVGDFVFQSHSMAINKSKSNKWLGMHVLTYGACFTPFILLGIQGIEFIVLNMVIHFVVDWITSRCTSRLWKAQQVHYFFVMIGLDQLIHQVTLLTTFYYMLYIRS